ncbi:MAG: class I SAM-dependent methyltransferase [Bacteroidetes bacterium]|nr:class I SAM-dependent methyltransferase [Bacteroidota bacterium]
MHIKFAKYFIDPKTQEPLELIIEEKNGEIIQKGKFKSGSNEYPIIRGIPRFINYTENNYAASFGYEWHKWPRTQFENENIGKPMEGHTRNFWEKVIGEKDINLQGKLVLDVGCGPGRFIDISREKGADVIGLDYSSAVEVANKNFNADPNVCICQADALMLPFKKQSFDLAYSIGVLHHTPNPKLGLEQIFQVVKSKGLVGICVYEKGGIYDKTFTHLWRKFFNLLKPIFKNSIPKIYTYCIVYFSKAISWVPPLRKTVKFFFPNCYLPDINWSLLDTFDMISPSYQSGHTSYEVFNWFKEIGFTQIEPSDWGNTSCRGFTK